MLKTEVTAVRPVLVGIAAFAINACASYIAQTEDARPGFNQHYGEIADPSVWPISAVGAVTVALFDRRSDCTGTLVGPKLVLTVAHCLFNGKPLVKAGTGRAGCACTLPGSPGATFRHGLPAGLPIESGRRCSMGVRLIESASIMTSQRDILIVL